tara:strand:- start:255 stop:854 length:600 start_codon:yes stop_codon:yes gene_type:complete
MKSENFKIVLLTILVFALTSCSPTNDNHSLNNAIVETIDAYQRKDTTEINHIIHEKFGLVILHQPTMFYQILVTDSIDSKLSLSYVFQRLRLKKHKIHFEELPEFSCNALWSKPPGIYCDTLSIDTTLSSTAKNDYAGRNWSLQSIRQFEEIENASYKIVVIGQQDDDLYGGDFFIFHLTLIDKKWYLTLIEKPDFCSA